MQRDGSVAQGFSASELAELVQDGFRTWSDAQCQSGLGTPGLTAVYRGVGDCDQVEYNCLSEDNSNLILFRDGPSDLTPFTLAQTTITASLSTGEILDADIEINSFEHDFDIDTRSSSVTDLRVVVNHELGHLLGLSHSQNPRALMQDRYDGGELPQQDDIAGICDIFGASRSDPICSEITQLEAPAQCVGSLSDDSCPPQVRTIVRPDSGCLLKIARGGLGGWSGPIGLLVGVLSLFLRRYRVR